MKFDLAKRSVSLRATMALVGAQLDRLDTERAQRVAAWGDWSDADRARYVALDAEYDVAFNALEDIREANGIAETSSSVSAL